MDYGNSKFLFFTAYKSTTGYSFTFETSYYNIQVTNLLFSAVASGTDSVENLPSNQKILISIIHATM